MTFAERESDGSVSGARARLMGGRADGPRGMQVTLSAGGKQYRQKRAGGAGTPAGDRGAAEQVVARSPGAALKQMNAASRRPGAAWIAGAGGAALAVLSLLAPLPVWGRIVLGGLAAGLAASGLRRARAAGARRFHLEYRFDAEARERWALLGHALGALARTERVWRITARGRAQGWKRDTGASGLVTRARVILRREWPAGLTGSVTPYCLRLGPQRWLFLPDRLYVLQDGTYAAAEYARLSVRARTTRFLEEERVPGDAQVVGAQSGVYITEYGVLEIEAPPSGLNPRLGALLHVSSVGAADQFAALFRSFQGYRASDAAMPPPSPPSAGCYARLGLTASCTEAEARHRFRRLVLAHHPDRAGAAGPDAREAANAEMQEIVSAYKDLKRLRGW